MSSTLDTRVLKQQLLRLQQELQQLEHAGREGVGIVELDQSRVGRLSRMDALQGQAMSAASQRRRHAMLRRVGPALARLERGDYGLCEDCDEPIAAARLQADPTSTTCIDCASERETRSR